MEGYDIVSMQATDKGREKEDSVEAFMEKLNAQGSLKHPTRRPQILVGTAKTVGLGRDLNVADTVIQFEVEQMSSVE